MARLGLIAGLGPVGDVLDQPIADHLGGERRAVEIQPDARRAARSVVGDRQPRPDAQRQRLAGADRDRVAGPEVDQPEERPAVVERQLVAAAAGVGPGPRLMQDDRARLRSVGISRIGQRERIGAAERPGARVHDAVVAAEPQRAGRARPAFPDELRAVLQPRRRARRRDPGVVSPVEPCRTPDGRPAPAVRSCGALPDPGAGTGRGPSRASAFRCRSVSAMRAAIRSRVRHCPPARAAAPASASRW